jgi:hypothetical protein
MDFIYLGSHVSPFEHQKDIDRNLMKYNKWGFEKKFWETDQEATSN